MHYSRFQQRFNHIVLHVAGVVTIIIFLVDFSKITCFPVCTPVAGALEADTKDHYSQLSRPINPLPQTY